MTDYRQQIIDYAMDKEAPYSEFQMQNFVLNTQITDYRILKQALLEIESRTQIVLTMEIELETNKLNIEIKEDEITEFDPDISKLTKLKLLNLELDRLVYDLRVNKKRYRQSVHELDVLIKYVQDSYTNIDDMTTAIEEDAELKEQHYWIHRMSKQAAMDVISQGRIGVGNMDAISCMSAEDQVTTLSHTLQYTNRLNEGMAQIEKAVQEGLLSHSDKLPLFDVPSITDKLLLNENIQPSSEPKIKSESV